MPVMTAQPIELLFSLDTRQEPNYRGSRMELFEVI